MPPPTSRPLPPPVAPKEEPLVVDRNAAGVINKIRWMMIISGATTVIAIAAVLGVVGYRLFRSDVAAAPADVTAMLPAGARVVSITTSEDRIVATIDLGGTFEVRTFDLRSLRPTGRLRFAAEP
jgi:hypothetical protein